MSVLRCRSSFGQFARGDIQHCKCMTWSSPSAKHFALTEDWHTSRYYAAYWIHISWCRCRFYIMFCCRLIVCDCVSSTWMDSFRQVDDKHRRPLQSHSETHLMHVPENSLSCSLWDLIFTNVSLLMWDIVFICTFGESDNVCENVRMFLWIYRCLPQTDTFELTFVCVHWAVLFNNFFFLEWVLMDVFVGVAIEVSCCVTLRKPQINCNLLLNVSGEGQCI